MLALEIINVDFLTLLEYNKNIHFDVQTFEFEYIELKSELK